MRTPVRNFILNINRALRSASALGIWQSSKLLASFYCPGEWHLKPNGISHQLVVRGRSSDPYLIYSIFCKIDYPVLPNFRFDYIIDGGANVGFSVAYFRGCFKNAEIIAVEPDAENYRCLVKNVKQLGRVKCLNRALWHQVARVSCVNSKTVLPWALQFQETDAADEDSVQTVSMREIIETCDPLGSIAVKLDIEGAEKQLFANDSSWLSLVDVLFIEIHDCWKEVFDALSHYEYKVYPAGVNLVVDLRTGDSKGLVSNPRQCDQETSREQIVER